MWKRAIGSLILGGLWLSFNLVSGQVIQEKTLNRPYEVRYNSCTDFKAFIGVPISELHLFAYRAAAGKWEAIPFQIDERDGELVPNYYATHNGLLDADDELAFMVKDFGDRVTKGNWVDDAAAKSYLRYEIEVYDSTVAPGSSIAWGYLYRSATITEKSPVSYLSYDAVNNRIKSLFYEVGYNAQGIMDYFAITPAGGGSGVDVLDRQKYFIEGIVPPNLEYVVTEEKFIVTKVLMVQGPIRILRRSLNDLKPMDDQDPWKRDQPMTSKFHPHFLQYSSGGIPFIQQWGVGSVRQTWDLNANAVGMKFHSPNNRDILVDGNKDAIVDTMEHNVLNWMMVTGNQGTVLAVNDLSFIGSSQRLYFLDDAKTHANDTGDKKSYGEMGIQITGYRIADTLTYKSNIFFLPGNQPHEIGDQVMADFANPVTEIRREQGFLDDVTDASPKGRITEYKLVQNYPNPFNPETTIAFEVPRAASVKIIITNVLGQSIKTLVNQNLPAGRHQRTWKGDNDKGQKVVSGIYFYLLESGGYRDVKKMILMD
ncbi:T9SS type A sorting domain-containing protein [candidate division KSB1 bacterium]|nr:T9SS type A sorting domain-containing protein [candidate division KSB1 bacterium]